jgi:hypothetical protein
MSDDDDYQEHRASAQCQDTLVQPTVSNASRSIMSNFLIQSDATKLNLDGTGALIVLGINGVELCVCSGQETRQEA